MKSKNITLILMAAALSGCGNGKNQPPKNDTTYSNGHMIVSPHVYSGSRSGGEESGISRGGFGESGGAHGAGE